MKVFVFTVALVLAVIDVTLAQRETSLRVVDALRELHPVYRDLQNMVVNTVAGAKLNSSEVVYRFQLEVAARKESFMKTAISAEANVLRQVNSQNIAVDTSCLGFLRQSAELNMNLAGVSFTNCLNTVDGSLTNEVTRIYTDLAVNESAYIRMSVYDAFRGQNVFVNPQAIVDRLSEKLTGAQQTPIWLAQELGQLVNAFEGRLAEVQIGYTNCLSLNDQLLQTTLSTVLVQLQQICLGTLVANEPTSEPEQEETVTLEPTEPTDLPLETVEDKVQPEPSTPSQVYANFPDKST